MKRILIIIWIIVIAIVIFCGYILWHNHAIEYKKSVKITTNDYNLLLSVKNIKSNIMVDSKEFTKIMVKLKNYRSRGTEFLGVTYELLNGNGLSLSYCSDGVDHNLNYEDILSNKVDGKSYNIGYLYCETKWSDFDKLKISVLSGNKELADGTYEFYFDDYYINLK